MSAAVFNRISYTPGIGYTTTLPQVLRRDEQLTIGSSSDPHEIWYRYNGRQLGFTGNNGSLESDYTQSVANRTIVAPATPGGFRNGATSATTSVEFDPSLQQISSYRQGAAGGRRRRRPEVHTKFSPVALSRRVAAAGGIEVAAHIGELPMGRRFARLDLLPCRFAALFLGDPRLRP